MTLAWDEANEAINEEFTQIEQLASAMSQMVGAIREVANHAEQASHATAETSQLAEEGSRCVAATVNTIDTLSGNIQRSSTVVNEVGARGRSHRIRGGHHPQHLRADQPAGP